jgi:HAD superfamily hydrolase (TIGR01509 family)
MQAVIFDMDGVILESEPLHDNAAIEVYESHGFGKGEDLSEMLNDFRGSTEYDFWSHCKKHFHLDPPLEDFFQWKSESFLRIIEATDIALMDGLEDVLLYLGVPLALASSSSYPAIDAIVDKLGIRDTFSVIVSGDDVEHGKPEPDIFLLAAKKLGIDPTECTVIEDSRNGVRAANAAGMRSIGFMGSPSNKQDLHEADTIIDHFDQLLSIVS